MSIFNELKSSLEEATEIKKGCKQASRVTRYEVADVREGDLLFHPALEQHSPTHQLMTLVPYACAHLGPPRDDLLKAKRQ